MSLKIASAVTVLFFSQTAYAFENEDNLRRPKTFYPVQQTSTVPVLATYDNDQHPRPDRFIEFIFGGAAARSAPAYDRPLRYKVLPATRGQQMPAFDEQELYERPREQTFAPPQGLDPKYRKQVVYYNSGEAPGTIVIDTPSKFLYLVQDNGKALRYGIGVGRPGFTWAGTKQVSAKREWPDWTPPPEMLKRRPDLPRHMAGGSENPLGARAIYLGSSLYRIHGSNEPWTIGTSVSSGCIRMRNEDVIDLYDRVNVGARVIVI